MIPQTAAGIRKAFPRPGQKPPGELRNPDFPGKKGSVARWKTDDRY